MLPKQLNSREIFCFLTFSSTIFFIFLSRSSISSTILLFSASTLRISSSKTLSTHLNKWFSFFRYIETKSSQDIIINENINKTNKWLSFLIENQTRPKNIKAMNETITKQIEDMNTKQIGI